MKNFTLAFALALLTVLGMHAQQDSFSGHVVADEGAWCWFADPRAIHYKNAAGTINSSYLGYIDVHGNVKATQMDYLTGHRTEVLVRSYFQPDDHNNPTFLVLPDERIFIIYSRHTDEAAFYYRISQKPGDITTLGAEHRIATANNTTYPSPFIMADDPNHVYLCWRGIGWHPTIGRLTMPDENDDMKFDWGPFQMVQSTGARPYAKYHSNGKDKIYVTYTTGHPDNEQPNWVYFNVVNINKGNGAILEDIKGNKLSTIADGKFNVKKTNDYKNAYPYTVVDAPSDRRDWVWQTTLDKDQNPVIAMVRINGGKSQHDYHYAKWTGSEWRVTFLANGGGRFHSSNTEYCYSGGMALDPESPNQIYLSVPVDGVYEIHKYTVDADGKVAATEAVTKNSAKNNVRPWVLPGSANSPLRLAWMNGDYYYWLVQKNYPKGYPTDIRCDYAWPETATVSAPVATKTYGKAMAAADKETLALPSALSKFTLNINAKVNADNYGGVILTAGNVVFGLDKETVLPYVTVNGKRYNSSNKLYTSDNWAINSGGTGGDNWPTHMAEFNTTITYDGSNLCVYRAGVLDQKVEAAGLSVSSLVAGGFDGTLGYMAAYSDALTAEGVKKMLRDEALNAIVLPTEARTDLVLPAKANGSSVAWTSSHPEVIAADGTMVAPEQSVEVTLTASLSGNTRTFKVSVPARDIEKNMLASYVFDTEKTVDGKRYVADASGNGNDLQVLGSAKVDGTLNLTANTAAGFATNGYALAPAALMNGLRSYTFMLDANASSLASAPRLYDFGANSGNSVFLRAKALAAGIKYAGGTTTMVSGSKELETGKDYKLAVTFDARTKTTTIYVNGNVSASGTQNVNEAYMIAASLTCDRNYIGRTQWWEGSEAKNNVDFVGTIDNFSLYNIALTAEEVRQLQGFENYEEDESLNIDCTSLMANPDFEGAYAAMNGSGVSADRAIYVPEGWTANYESRNENDMTILNSDCLYASLFNGIPTNVGGGKNAYLVRQKWGTSTIGFSQDVKVLKAGYYRLSANLWQTGDGGQGTIWAKAENGESHSASAAETNKQEWQTGNVKFMANGAEGASLGFSAVHSTNEKEKYVGFDNFKLHDVTANCSRDELLDLIAYVLPTADALLKETLTDASRQALQQAVDAANQAGADTEREALVTIAKNLSDAIANAEKTSGISDIINAEEAQPQAVYDLTGRRVLDAADSDKIDTLPAGVYIQGARKIMVK